jgi:hypothetical protein
VGILGSAWEQRQLLVGTERPTPTPHPLNDPADSAQLHFLSDPLVPPHRKPLMGSEKFLKVRLGKTENEAQGSSEVTDRYKRVWYSRG